MKLSNKILLAAFLIAAAFFQSCKKDRVGLQDAPDRAKIALFNVATPTRSTSTSVADIQGYQFFLDGVQMFTAPFVSNKTTGYVLVEPGQRVLRADTTAAVVNVVRPSAVVNTTNINAEAGKFYSVFYTGKNQSPEVVVTTDDLTRPTASKVKIRVINLSPDAGALDIAGRLTSDVTPRQTIFTNATYKTANAFTEITPGYYSLEVRPTATTTALSTFTNDNQTVPQFLPSSTSRTSFAMLFEADKIYTLVIRGYQTPTIAAVGQLGNPLSVGAVINLFF